MSPSLRNYYEVTKPGIIYGNSILFIGGFALALTQVFLNHSVVGGFLSALVGLSLVEASGCVFNNYFDRRFDAKMERTKQRVLVLGGISRKAVLSYATVLACIGFFILIIGTNIVATLVTALGFFFYVVVYTLWAKPRTLYAVFLGAVSGAVPPVVGYTALVEHIDRGAILLFLMMIAWQVPHFLAISIRRKDDYQAAGVPIFPTQYDNFVTKVLMVILILVFTSFVALLVYGGYVGRYSGTIGVMLGIIWFVLGIRGFWAREDVPWGRLMFFFSLAVLIGFFVSMILESFLHVWRFA